VCLVVWFVSLYAVSVWVRACAYVCGVCVCVYACVCVCVLVRMFVCWCVSERVSTHVRACRCVCSWPRRCMQIVQLTVVLSLSDTYLDPHEVHTRE